MTRTAWLVALAWTASAAVPAMARQGDVCADALARAAVQVQALDDGAAARMLAEAPPQGGTCAEAVLARTAIDGWIEARGLAAIGGDPSALGAINGILRALDLQVRDSAASLDRRLAAEYAVAALRAAVAAAQDERGEMDVFLIHARDLAGRLVPGGAAPLWPLDIDELEGELWLEVDRYDDARAAFERAAAAARGARALVGLARTLRRLGDAAGACAAYRRADALAMSDDARREVRTYLSDAPCGPPGPATLGLAFAGVRLPR